jgi:hypothetical protein
MHLPEISICHTMIAIRDDRLRLQSNDRALQVALLLWILLLTFRSQSMHSMAFRAYDVDMNTCIGSL